MARHLGWDAARAAARLEELATLTRFPADALARYPNELSGGQAQRVAMMRALLLDPEVLLLDEPLAALDPLVRAELRDDLRGIFRSLGKTVVLVTHDLGEAAHLADVVVLMRDGRVVQQGPFATLAAAPADPFVTAFLGDRQRDRGAHRAAAMTRTARAATLVALRGVAARRRRARRAAACRSESKAFTESVILGEMVAALRARRRRARRAPPPARRHRDRVSRARDRRRRRLSRNTPAR